MNKDKLPIPSKEVKLKEKTKLVNQVTDAVQSSNSTEENKLIKLVELLEHQLLLNCYGIKNSMKEKPFWKRRIENQILMQLPKHVGLIEIWEAEMLKKIGHKTRLDQLD